MQQPRYQRIVDYYERHLTEHGTSHKGVAWPKADDVDLRNQVMFNICGAHANRLSILDLGCGFGLFADYLRATNRLAAIDYFGIDLSRQMVEEACRRHPDLRFEARDVLVAPLVERSFDYVIMNGLLTVKASLSQAEMEEFATAMIQAAFQSARHGLAFNVMSEHVDWKREDLFHWPFDQAASFLKRACSRHVVFRADYGLYEYTVYVYREPNR
ncbi:MAG: class I SAM-dependent methyltransferase [Pseudomonadota bacterium]